MAPKAKTHKGRKFTIPMAIVAGLIPGLANSFNHLTKGGGIDAVRVVASRDYLGFDPRDNSWKWDRMWGGTLPIVVGMVVHKAASVLGVNRALGRAGIPFFRL